MARWYAVLHTRKGFMRILQRHLLSFGKLTILTGFWFVTPAESSYKCKLQWNVYIVSLVVLARDVSPHIGVECKNRFSMTVCKSLFTNMNISHLDPKYELSVEVFFLSKMN